MRAHPICSFLSTLLVLIVVTTTSLAAEYNQIQHRIDYNPKTRRILHQPLFPSTSSSPPPPEINSEPIFPTPDHPFFPEVPTVQTPDQTQIPPIQPNGTPISRTNPIATTQPTNPTKKLAIAVSVGIVTLGMLSALGFYIYKHKTKHPDETQKLVNTNSFHREEEESRMPSSNFLYIGTVEPSSSSSSASQTQINHSIVANNTSPYRKLSPAKKSDRYRPSPELQPLPPLRNHHTVFTPPTIINSSDEDETKIYKPYNISSTSIMTKSNNSIPHSKRTSPRLSLSCSSPDIKRAIIVPSVKQTSPPSLPPPQPQEVTLQHKKPTLTYVPQRVKFSAPPPPPDMSRLKSISNQYQQTSKPPAPPPPPPPPPPPLSTSRKLGGGVGSRATNSIEPHLLVSSPSVSSPVKPQSSSPTPNSTHVASEKRSHLEEQNRGAIHDTDTSDDSKPRLKPLHWDKVRATSERATVWDQLKSSSFQLNEDMMESLFGCNSVNSVPNEVSKRSARPPVEKENRVLDPKKSQNIAIMLRALNVTKDEVSEALLDGSAEGLGPELLESLVKMAPTKEEEIKLRDYNGDTSKLGSAERFLKAILDVPFAFKRVEAMLYRANFDAEVKDLRKSFQTLEEASQELKNSRLFFKLLEAVLRAGNRMNVGTNRGDARAFKLETLLKLIDIKGTDGKTTLLHFVVQEIIRSEGLGSDTKDDNNLPSISNIKLKEEEFKKQGLQVVAGLSRELGNVKKAAGMDSDVLSGYVSKLEAGLVKVRSVLQYEKKGMEGNFFESMTAFLKEAEDGIVRIKAEERKALSMVKEVTEYFHGDAAKEEAHPLRIFMIVRDFLCILDSVCKDVGMMQDRTMVGAARSFRIATTASLPVLNRFNARQDRSWDDDSSSP